MSHYTCPFCLNKIAREGAAGADWTPAYFTLKGQDGPPVCPDCTLLRLHVDKATGEWEQKAEARRPAVEGRGSLGTVAFERLVLKCAAAGLRPRTTAVWGVAVLAGGVEVDYDPADFGPAARLDTAEAQEWVYLRGRDGVTLAEGCVRAGWPDSCYGVYGPDGEEVVHDVPVRDVAELVSSLLALAVTFVARAATPTPVARRWPDGWQVYPA